MIIRCLEVRHLKFSSSVEYLRWRPSFLECRWVSPGGCHRAERVSACPQPPWVPQTTCFWGGWEFDSCGASPSLRGRVGSWRGPRWEQGRMHGRLEIFFTVNFNSGAGRLGVTGWFSAEGEAEISSVFSSSKTICIPTPQSLRPSLKEYSAILKKLVTHYFILPLIAVSGSWESWNHHQGSYQLDPLHPPLPPCFFFRNEALAWDEKAEPTILRYSIVIQINSWSEWAYDLHLRRKLLFGVFN